MQSLSSRQSGYRGAQYALVVLSVAVLAVGLPCPSSAQTQRVSLGHMGQEGNDHSTTSLYGLSSSARGSVIAFSSFAGNLVPNDTNGTADVFVRDMETGETELISVSMAGVSGNGMSYNPAISRDGRFVAFASLANDLVPDDTNGSVDVFLRDRLTDTTIRVSTANDGTEGNYWSSFPSIASSPDDSQVFIAFTSAANNLVPGDMNGAPDIFHYTYNVGDGTSNIVRASVGGGGLEGDEASVLAAISAGGRFIVYTSYIWNIIPPTTTKPLPPVLQILVYDHVLGHTFFRLITTPDEGTFPAISGDGRFFAYIEQGRVILYDLLRFASEVVSVADTGADGNGPSEGPSLSDDGRFVAFTSAASNLVSGDTNGVTDVFVRDRAMRRTTRVSLTHDGREANGPSRAASISDDGRRVVFSSSATNLVPDDTNLREDVFVTDTELFQPGSQPDLLIRTGGETWYVGNDIYNTSGVDQTRAQTADWDRPAVYHIKLQNDGSSPDTFLVTGGGSGGGWTVRYYDALAEGVEVTADVVGPGWPVGPLSPGETTEFRVEVVPEPGVPPQAPLQMLVTATSRLEATKADTVMAVTTKAVSAAQPDMLIRNAGETLYAGNDVYNETGQGQQRAQAAAWDEPAVYYLKVQNDGTLGDSFVITGPGGGSGWVVTYYDQLEGGANITAQVTGSGWTVGPLAPAGFREFRVEVSLEPGSPPEAPVELIIAARSTADSAKSDAVLAVTSRTLYAYQPDMLIRAQDETLYVGNDIYNTTGYYQNRSRTAWHDQPAVYHLKVQNDGTASDSFVVTGTGSGGGWIVRYYDQLQGGGEITSGVTGAGWTVGPLAPGMTRELRVEVALESGVTGQAPHSLLVAARSAADSARADAVAAVTTRATLEVQPDMLIRNADETWYVGNDIYNTNGRDQTRYQTADRGRPAVYHLKLQNDGSAADTFTITGGRGGDGWVVTYYDALEAGGDVTARVTAGGWTIGPLAPGAFREFRVELALEEGVIPDDRRVLLITARSDTDGAVVDTVKADTSVAVSSAQPDMLIRTDPETLYVGGGIYNTTGRDQTRNQQASRETPAVYQLKLRNDGSIADGFVVTGTGREEGWVVRYYDAMTGGADITAQVTGGGWTVGPLAPADTREFRVEVSLEAGVTPTANHNLLVTARSLGDSTKADTVRGVTSRAPVAYQPDMLIRAEADTLYIGDDIYNASGYNQVRTQTARRDAPAVYVLKVQNDGTATDSFLLTGVGGGAGWVVTYTDGPAGGADITTQVTGAGWTVGPLASGAIRELRVEVAFEPGTPPALPHQLIVSARSLADSAAVDTVRGITTGLTSPSQPDMLIRRTADPLYVGNDIYNTTGQDQTVSDTAGWDRPAVYVLKLQNDGSISDSFLVTGTGGGAGWVVTYYDAAEDGADITSQVTGSGYAVGPLAAGNSVEFRAVVSLEPGVPPQARHDLVVTAISIADSATRDVVRARTTRTTLSSQPDLLIRTAADTWYVGNDLYNADADQQSVSQAARWNEPAVFHIKLQNDGPVTDSFVITGAAGGAGWVVTYRDALTGGSDITAQVVGGGWFVGPLIPGASHDFRLEMTIDAGVPSAAERRTLVTAASATDSERLDAVRAVARPPEARQFQRDFGPGLWLIGIPANPVDPRADRVLGTTRAAAWNAGTQSYTNLQYRPFDLAPGMGVWVRYPDGQGLSFSGYAPAGAVTRELVRDWNLLGNPGTSTMPWSGVAASGSVQPLGWVLNDAGTGYDLVSNLNLENTRRAIEPWQGFWLKANENCMVTLSGAATQAAPEAAAPAGDGRVGWAVRLAARVGEATDAHNHIGVAAAGEAITGANPPPPGAGYVDLYVLDDDGGRNAVSLHPAGAERFTWDLTVETDVAQGRVEVSFGDLSGAPGDLALILQDLDGGRTVNMRTAAGYSFLAGEDGARRRLRVEARPRGGPALITAAAAQPHGRGAGVVYTLAGPAEVSIEVLNIAGRAVARIPCGYKATGTHTAHWTGVGLNGTRAPAGRYLLSVRALGDDGTVTTRVLATQVQ